MNSTDIGKQATNSRRSTEDRNRTLTESGLATVIVAPVLSLDPWMGDFEWSSARFGAVSRAVDVAAHV